MRDLGVRVGFVWKKDKNGWQQVNTLRPLAAFNVPVAIVDPGPDGVVATSADNGTFAFLNLDDTTRGSSQVTTNIDGYEGTYKTLEIAANKRYSQRWSLNASLSYTGRTSSATTTSTTGSGRRSRSSRSSAATRRRQTSASTTNFRTGSVSSAARSTPGGAFA